MEQLEAIKDATARVREAAQALGKRQQLRQANLQPARPDDSALKGLDSSMKRNTALTRKLRQLSEDTRQSILDDIAKTNQSKYVSEAVAAISEANIKLKDTAAAVQICSSLHQRYAEFGPAVVDALAKTFSAPSTEEDRAALLRRRATLRLLLELLLVGLYSSPGVLVSIVRQLAGADFEREPEGAQASLALLAVLAKAGRTEALGLPPALPAAVTAKGAGQQQGEGDAEDPHLAEAQAECQAAVQEYEAELQQQYTLPAEAQQQLLVAVERCFDAACAALEQRHAALQETEQENARVLNSRGDLPEDMAAAYEAQRRSFEGLQRNTAALAEALDRKLPELRETVTRMAAGPAGVSAVAGGAGEEQVQQVFEDEEARAFYESLPDIRAVVPAVLLGENKGKGAGAGEEGGEAGPAPGEEDSSTSEAAAADAGQDAAADRLQQALASLQQPEGSSGTWEPPPGGGAGEPGDGFADILEGNVPGEGAKEASQLDLLFTRLRSCVSKDLADELAVNFCYMQNKKARKRLARALCDIPTGALQLLPYYSRILATLSQVFPDILAAVTGHLEAEFRQLQAQKDATIRTLEPRIRNIRYVGELCKFRAFPFGTAFSMLKALLDDFSGHNIDAACALVETAGRFFYRLPETSTRMSNMIEVMAKLRNARNLDVRQSGLVDSAYFAVKAADKAVKRKQRPPVHEYVRHLVYDRLALGEVTKVLKKLRRLSWAENEPYLLATLLRASHKGRYSQIPHIASLAAGLSRYHPTLGVRLVDAVLEGILAGLEAPDAGCYQRLVAYVRLLGELYNYKLLDSKVVFATLHLLLAFGYEPGTPPEMTRRLDPPFNYFRIRLVCTLLETCGQYFTKGSARKKLDRFLPYLQRYVLSKPPLPLDVEFDLQELLEGLRIQVPQYASFQEACQAVAELEAEAAAAAAQGLPGQDEESEEERSDAEGGSEGSDGEGEEEGAAEDDGEEDGAARMDDDGDEDVAVLRQASAPVEMDEDFERDFAQLMQDYQGARPAARQQQFAGGAPAAAAAPAAAGPESAGPADNSMVFKVVMRRGGKEDRSRELLIPVSASMAHHLKEKEEREAAEKAEVKRLVLEAEKRELQELRQQQQAAAAARGQQQHRRGRGGYYSRGGGHHQAGFF